MISCRTSRQKVGLLVGCPRRACPAGTDRMSPIPGRLPAEERNVLLLRDRKSPFIFSINTDKVWQYLEGTGLFCNCTG